MKQYQHESCETDMYKQHFSCGSAIIKSSYNKI